MKSEYWSEMHKILGTSETTIKPLTEVAEKVRHGNLSHPLLIQARKNRDQIINIGIDVMRREFKLKFKGLFK